MDHIDPYSYIAKYHQLSELLLQKIEDGEWQPYQPIPSQRDLASTYNVSLTTVREALDVLSNRGYIYCVQGSGTYVTARAKFQHNLHSLRSFTKDMQSRGIKPAHKILSFDMVDVPNRIYKFAEILPEQKQILQVERLVLGDDEPFGIHTSYVFLAPGQEITRQELETSGSLYTLLEKKFNLIPLEGEEIIESTIANEREAALLNISKGSPLLLFERMTWSFERKPMEYVVMLHRGDRYKCYIHLTP